MNNHKRAYTDDRHEKYYPNKRQKLQHDIEAQQVFGINDLIFVISSKLLEINFKSLLAFSLVNKRFNGVVRSRHLWERSVYSNIVKIVSNNIDALSQSLLSYLVARSSRMFTKSEIKLTEDRLNSWRLKSYCSQNPSENAVLAKTFGKETWDQFITNRSMTEYAFFMLSKALTSSSLIAYAEMVPLIEERFHRQTRTEIRIFPEKETSFASVQQITWYPNQTRHGFTLILEGATLWIWKKILPDNKAILYVFSRLSELWKNIRLAVITHDPPLNTIEMQRVFVGDNNTSHEFMANILQRDLSTFVTLERVTDILFRTPEPRTLCSFSESSFADSGVITLVMEQLLTSIPDLFKLRVLSKKHKEFVSSLSPWLALGFSDGLNEARILTHLCALLHRDAIRAELNAHSVELHLIEQISRLRRAELQLTDAIERDIDDNLLVRYIIAGYKPKRDPIDDLEEYCSSSDDG